MPFDRETYTTMATYEAFLLAEISRRMKNSEINGTVLENSIIEGLKRNGIMTPGALPKVLDDNEVQKKRCV